LLSLLVVMAGISVSEAKQLTVREVNAIVDALQKRGM
jgi:ketol-acid reductoisomerase